MLLQFGCAIFLKQKIRKTWQRGHFVSPNHPHQWCWSQWAALFFGCGVWAGNCPLSSAAKDCIHYLQKYVSPITSHYWRCGLCLPWAIFPHWRHPQSPEDLDTATPPQWSLIVRLRCISGVPVAFYSSASSADLLPVNRALAGPLCKTLTYLRISTCMLSVTQPLESREAIISATLILHREKLERLNG